MDDLIADTEPLAIFVYDSEKMKQDGAHWKAFLPGKKDGERSFFRVVDLTDDEIKAIGEREAASRPKQQLRGVATIVALEVSSRPPLTLTGREPPERHGVILGWPTESQDKNKLAMELAGKQKHKRFG